MWEKGHLRFLFTYYVSGIVDTPFYAKVHTFISVLFNTWKSCCCADDSQKSFLTLHRAATFVGRNYGCVGLD